jgi:hypothetical protein
VQAVFAVATIIAVVGTAGALTQRGKSGPASPMLTAYCAQDFGEHHGQSVADLVYGGSTENCFDMVTSSADAANISVEQFIRDAGPVPPGY